MDIKDISFSYHKQPFIEAVNAVIEPGRITTIIGPNGSGKSTLLNLCIQQLMPKSGNIILDNIQMKDLKVRELAKKISAVHQHNVAPMDISVEELVYYGRTPYHSFWKRQGGQDQEIVEWAMEAMHLTKMREKPLATLSGGERQRVFIALALAQKTEILFLDEPTTYLDIAYQIEILSLLKQLNKDYQMTIVMVLHDLNQAMEYSHNILAMKNGALYGQGGAKQVITETMLAEVYQIQAQIREHPVKPCLYMIPIAKKEKQE